MLTILCMPYLKQSSLDDIFGGVPIASQSETGGAAVRSVTDDQAGVSLHMRAS